MDELRRGSPMIIKGRGNGNETHTLPAYRVLKSVISMVSSLLTIKQDLKGWGVLTVIGNAHTRASNDFSWFTISVDFLYPQRHLFRNQQQDQPIVQVP
jgi:hypothetical protein